MADDRDDELIVIPGGWPAIADLESLFGIDTDTEYEDVLRVCRQVGHNLDGGFADGREFLRCSRCGTRFEEMDP